MAKAAKKERARKLAGHAAKVASPVSSTQRRTAQSKSVLLVATRKGAWILRGDTNRRQWHSDGPHFLGHVIHHMVLDPRDGRTLLASAKTGHLGPTIFRSTDCGRNWKEAAQPPAFAKAQAGDSGRSVDHTFWLTPGHSSEPGVWYAGTSPQGLFRSDDGGIHWGPVFTFNEDPQYLKWFGTAQDGTPDGPKLHSILVDPRDLAHLYFGMSGGGVHESVDRGRTWRPIVAGLEVVEGLDAFNIAVHDPHCVRLCPSNPDRLYQQNHCGIYRIDRPSAEWSRIGRSMPKRIGDIGFPIVVHPRDADAAWVFPMDGTSVWPRTCVNGIPAVYVTRNGGKSWQRCVAGLPEGGAWWTVKRQAMSTDDGDPVGVYFGTTSGEMWASRDEGQRWICIARHFPEIYAVESGRLL